MLRFSLLASVLALATMAAGQAVPFKYDSTNYKTVYWSEAFALMDNMPMQLLLDVRSPGEYADTARATMLNIGRIKDARNLSIDSVQSHLEDLKPYMDKPIFIYCSHSQRSRRVSKLLAENGFKTIYNINGGMSVLNESGTGSIPRKNEVLVTSTLYKNIAGADAITLLKNTRNLAVVDIRTEKEFANQDTALANNIGHIRNAVNIPQDKFEKVFDSYKIDNARPVLLYDLNGYNSMDVTDFLRSKGFTKLYNLYGGLASLMACHELTQPLRRQLFVETPAYNLLDPAAAIELLKTHQNTIVLDLRSQDEFESKAKMDYLNVGNMKGAIHIDSVKAVQRLISSLDKSAPVLIYGSGNNLDALVCDELVREGFTNVNRLHGSYYHFAWSTFNLEDCKDGKQFLANHEGLF